MITPEKAKKEENKNNIIKTGFEKSQKPFQ